MQLSEQLDLLYYKDNKYHWWNENCNWYSFFMNFPESNNIETDKRWNAKMINKKFKRNKIDNLTRDILLKNIDNIIIFQNEKINIKFR